MEDEPLYYNAVATALHGDTRAIRRIRRATWRESYETLASDAHAAPAGTPPPEQAWDPLERHGIRLVLAGDPGFPEALKGIPQPPLALYIRGVLPVGTIEARPTVAIVGTRRGSPRGLRTAAVFGRALAEAGCVIASGLALGIDAAAHRGALEARGPCIAVIANGLSHVRPSTNARLAEMVLETGGCIVSEYPPDEEPLPQRFIERNRLISGFASGTLVIEAPERSGSLATADFALEQGREVFAVPGPIDDPLYRGSNGLIRQGATLVTKPNDILEAFGIAPAPSAPRSGPGGSREETLIMKALESASGALEVDKIITMTKLEPRIAIRTLGLLVVKNIARETGGGYILETNYR
ncbi:MAG TPA: DNA-processing protein DprA [Candidatus Paceibacterota bacterium]|nr:DNA-processing protein DprA [Candidatus Paceibacterota bacterium]